MFKRGPKKRLSIDFTEDAYNYLNTFKKCYTDDESYSNIINYLVETILSLSSEVKDNIAEYCNVELKKLNSINESKITPFHVVDIHMQKKDYANLISFFTNGNGIVEKNTNVMNRIYIKNGYVIFPKDWVTVNYKKPEDCEYVGVVETKNGAKYNAPHFLFFASQPIHTIKEVERKKILNECCKAYPDFRNVLNQEIELVFNEDGIAINAEEWDLCPCPGLFEIADFGQRDSYPCGAIVYRTET